MLEAAPTGPLPPLSTIAPDITRLADYERLAQTHLPPSHWQHIQGGVGDALSLADNRQQFDDYRLVPRALQDMRGASTAIDLFGHSHAAPFLLAPIAYHRLAHPEGELATMRAATALGISMIVSTLSSYTLEDIAAAAQQASTALAQPAAPPHWFQLYFQPHRDQSATLVRRAEAAGYAALVVTIDAAVKRSDFALPGDVTAANLRDMPQWRENSAPSAGHVLFGSALMDAAPTWDSIRWLRSITNLPIVIKGILSLDDAMKARDIGADAIILSNHGGRVIDGLAPPLIMLPIIAKAVANDLIILMDSGVRTGTDMIKALALGAKAVLIGRPQLHALAVAGMQGVAHMLHLLRAELELAMAHIGCPTPHMITADHIMRHP